MHQAGGEPAAGGASEFDEKAESWDEPAKVARAEEVARAIASQVPLSPGMSALEYGAGTGLLSFALRDRLGHITLADSSPGMLAVARRKIEVSGATNLEPVLLNLSRDRLPDRSFDLVLTLLTLHHVPDAKAMLRSFHALLRSPGHLCVADLDREDGSFHGPEAHVHHGFDRAELVEAMRQAGFSEVRVSTATEIVKPAHDGHLATYPVFLAIGAKR